MDSEKIKHLEFIQNIITRMNTNSFQIKTWAITIVAALLALSVSANNKLFILIGVIPALMFWFLDAYYLMMERKFRGLYNDVAGLKEISSSVNLFDMDLKNYKGGKFSYWSVLFSPTIIILYGIIILLLILIYFIALGV